uniref:Uncharacterized protein n=1 Tax=Megaselia scalaris TaxID=36166 RepID=T1H5M2_MEGSC
CMSKLLTLHQTVCLYLIRPDKQIHVFLSMVLLQLQTDNEFVRFPYSNPSGTYSPYR